MDMIYYFLAFGAAVLYAGGFVFQKFWQMKIGSSPAIGNLFSSLMGFCTSLALTVILLVRGTTFSVNWFNLSCAVGGILLVALYRLVGFGMMKYGSMTLFTLFLMVGGMVVPYLFGVFYYHETPGPARILGLIVIIVGVIFSNIPEKESKVNTRVILLGVAAFMLNGTVGAVLKIHQMDYQGMMAPTEGYMIMQSISLCVISLIMAAVMFAKEHRTVKVTLSRPNGEAVGDPSVFILPIGLSLLIGFSAALSNGIGDVFQLLSASHIDASAQFPICTGGCIACSALADILFFKMRPSRHVLCGILLCLAGTCCFLFH